VKTRGTLFVISDIRNSFDQVVATIANNGQVATLFQYESYGNIKKVSNANEQESEYTYTYLGQLKSKNTPDEGATLYAYNHSGLLMLERNAKLDVRLYNYDDYGRIILQAVQHNTGPTFDMFLPAHDGNPWLTDRDYVAFNAALNSVHTLFEKEWFYEEYNNDIATSLHPGVKLYADFSISNSKGRLAQTTSFDPIGKPIEFKLVSYNNDGFLKWEIVQFNEGGIGPGAYGLAVRIDYPKYNLQGRHKIQNIDLSCNQSLDFQYAYEYDSWNRFDKVMVSYTNTGINGFKVVDYDYDDVLGVVDRKKYFDSGLTEDESQRCLNVEIDQIDFTYDIRERLTLIDSRLFDWQLFYDDDVISGGVKNWNGNINGSIGSYHLNEDYVVNKPDNFLVPTIYGYTYDNLNRLVRADATVSIITGPELGFYSGNQSDVGDASFQYDKIGNILSAHRGIILEAPGGGIGGSFGFTHFLYTYSPGKNRLTSLQASGLVPENCHDGDNNYSFSYDATGNMLSDSRRGIGGVGYERTNLPWSITITPDGCGPEEGQSVRYLYDANDARIYKRTNTGEEFYLRDALGQELAVFNKSIPKLVWYVYGNERVAKIEHQPEIDLDYCENEAPECTPEMKLAQQITLQSIIWELNPENLVYPIKLFRVILCDGMERYMLPGEIQQLFGNYTILQQIDVSHADQDFVLRIGTDLITYTDFAGVLSQRLNTTEDLVINDYDPCVEMPCQNEFYFCTNEMTREQSEGLLQLLNDLNGLSLETYPLPTNLMRVRICDGREIYVLPEWLDYLGGYYTIVDQILITSYLQELDVDFPDGSTHTVVFKDLASVLFTVGMEITINDYESCFEDLPCDDAPVTCEVPYLTERQNDWIQNVLIGSFFPNQSSENITYPTKLYRVRFCEGVELYLFHQELYSGYSLGGYKILQVIEVLGTGQNFEVKDATGSRILVGVQPFLNYRAHLIDDFAVNGYNCDPFPTEDGDTCPDGEVAGQQTSLVQVRNSMSERTPATIQIPQNLLRIKFCDGTEDHILTEELPLLSGTLHELQIIPIEDTLQTYQTATLNGVENLSLGEMLQLRSTPQAMYLEGFEPQDPVETAPLPPVWGGGDPFGEALKQLKDAPIPEVSFYIQDHLGNTRILYHTTFTGCNQAAVLYHLEHVADYYPFGKILREYVAQGVPEKFLTTQHERDVETGLDYRGARFYDSEVGRFLSVDPLASVIASWSPYVYVYNNPVRFTDPDGLYTRGEKTTSLASFINIFKQWEVEAIKYRISYVAVKWPHTEPKNKAKFRIFDNDFRATKQIVTSVGADKNFSYNKSFGKYLNVGLPLDVAHFFKMASLAQDLPGELIRNRFIAEEFNQAKDPRPAGRTSAFSPEDIFSNELGLIFGKALGGGDDMGAELEIFLLEVQTLFTTNQITDAKYLTEIHVNRLRGYAQKYYGTENLSTFLKEGDIYTLESINIINDNAEQGNLPLTGTPASEEH